MNELSRHGGRRRVGHRFRPVGRRAVDGDAAFRQQSQQTAELDKLPAYLFDRSAIAFAEVGDGLVIGCQPPKQPHHFQISIALALQTPGSIARDNDSLDVELQVGRRVLLRPADVQRFDRLEPSFLASSMNPAISAPAIQ
jgi:hypothetical protein